MPKCAHTLLSIVSLQQIKVIEYFLCVCKQFTNFNSPSDWQCNLRNEQEMLSRCGCNYFISKSRTANGRLNPPFFLLVIWSHGPAMLYRTQHVPRRLLARQLNDGLNKQQQSQVVDT